MSKYRELTEAQVQSFLDKGYLVVKNVLDRDLASQWIDGAYKRLGYDRNDQTTWEKDIIWMDHSVQRPIKEIAPRAWNAILDVIGGEERLETKVMGLPSGHFTTIDSWIWSDAFIVNFRRGADREWVPPSPQSGGWHKDGSYFKHFLDSREQSLLTIVCWSDMKHQGGATYISPDSVRLIARHLAAHPEGVPPGEFDFQSIIEQCNDFEEVTGEAGDFVIMHPFILHASSNNKLRVPRFMSNPPVVLKEPMKLNRENPEDFSLLERATLHYLGLERLDFQPTAPREGAWWYV